MAGQGSAPQITAADAGLGSPRITSPHITNVMIAAATVAAAKAAHDVGLGPPPSMDPTAAAAAASMAVMGSAGLPVVTSPRLNISTATVQTGTSPAVPAGVATVPMGSPDGTTAPKTIGMMGMTPAQYGLLNSVASANVLSNLIAAQSMEEGELRLEIARTASLSAAAAATAATSPMAPLARLQLPSVSKESSKQSAVGDALLSPFAAHTIKGTLEKPHSATRQSTAKQSADASQDKTAAGSLHAKHSHRPNNAATAPSRLGPAGSSRPPTAAGAGSKAAGGGSKVTAFKITNPGKQLVQRMSAAAAATFERGVSPEESAAAGGGSRHNSPALSTEVAAGEQAAAAPGTTLSAGQQPPAADSQQQQQMQQRQRRSSSPDAGKSRRWSSSSGRRTRSRSSTRGRSRTADSRYAITGSGTLEELIASCCHRVVDLHALWPSQPAWTWSPVCTYKKAWFLGFSACGCRSSGIPCKHQHHSCLVV